MLAILAGSAASSLASAGGGVAASESAQGIEDVGVDVLQDVEDAQLVAGVGPHVGQHRGVQIRAVGDDHVRGEAVGLEVVQDASHVALVVGRHQGEGDGEIADRVGGQEQGAVPQVQFIDAQAAGEVRQSPPAVGGQVGLADLPVEAVGQEPGGQVEEEVASHRLLEAVQAQAVVEEAVADGVAHPVGVLGARFDPIDVGAERRATVAGGAVLSDRQFDDEDVSVGEVTNESRVGALATTGRAAVGAGEGVRRTTLPANVNTGGVHACVLRGSVW